MGDWSMTFARVAVAICVVAGIANAVQSQWSLAGFCLVLTLMLAPTAVPRPRQMSRRGR